MVDLTPIIYRTRIVQGSAKSVKRIIAMWEPTKARFRL
jgi:hypothetical protein